MKFCRILTFTGFFVSTALSIENAASPTNFDAYVPANFQELIAAGGFEPNNIPVESIDTVFKKLTVKFQATYDYAKRLVQPDVFLHCIRDFYYAYALLETGYPSNTAGAEQISREELVERVYLGCILHDISIGDNQPEILAHPSHDMSFELEDGIIAYDHLLKEYPNIGSKALGEVVQGIMLHTIIWKQGNASSTESLIGISAVFDVGGYDFLGPGFFDKLWSRDFVAEVEKQYPKPKGVTLFSLILKHVTNKPNSILPRVPESNGALPQK